MLDPEKKVLLGRSVDDNTDREQKIMVVTRHGLACRAGRRATGEGIMVVRNKKTSTATTTLYTNDLKLTK